MVLTSVVNYILYCPLAVVGMCSHQQCPFHSSGIVFPAQFNAFLKLGPFVVTGFALTQPLLQKRHTALHPYRWKLPIKRKKKNHLVKCHWTLQISHFRSGVALLGRTSTIHHPHHCSCLGKLAGTRKDQVWEIRLQAAGRPRPARSAAWPSKLSTTVRSKKLIIGTARTSQDII